MLAITGANGHLGQRLLASPPERVRALVRSERAAAQIQGLCRAHGAECRTLDYADAEAFADALAGCRAVVHLVGIIRETRGSRYEAAHEHTCAALATAAARAGVQRIVYLSILGAAPGSANACLASKGRAEALLCAGTVPVTVLRVPMVLGENDHAATAIARRARRSWNVLLRGASLEQPIYAGDVVAAVRAAADRVDGSESWELAGPESLSRSELTQRAAALLGHRTRIVSVPLALGRAAAGVFEAVSSDPPVTRAMLGVLDHDDRIDPAPAAAALGVSLTPLDEVLRRCLAAPQPAG